MARKKPRRKMTQLSLLISLAVAVVFDLLNIIPFIPFGLIFTFLAGLIYRIEGYSGGLMKRKMGKQVLKIASVLIEAIPGINILPGCIIFVLVAFSMNRSAIKKQEIEEMLAQKTQITAYLSKVKRLQR